MNPGVTWINQVLNPSDVPPGSMISSTTRHLFNVGSCEHAFTIGIRDEDNRRHYVAQLIGENVVDQNLRSTMNTALRAASRLAPRMVTRQSCALKPVLTAPCE